MLHVKEIANTIMQQEASQNAFFPAFYENLLQVLSQSATGGVL